MWSWLASLIGGPVITGLINAYKAKLDAANTQDRIAADLAAKEIEADIAARKEASAVIHRRAGPMVYSDYSATAGIPARHLSLEGDRLGQGARSRQHRSYHRHGRGMDWNDR